jgi:hypothetical protein
LPGWLISHAITSNKQLYSGTSAALAAAVLLDCLAADGRLTQASHMHCQQAATSFLLYYKSWQW